MATSDRNDWLSLELWNWSITPQGCWTVACGMFNVAWWGCGSQKSTFSCSVHWAKTASWASADDEWLHSVDAVGASCFHSSVTDVEACASFLHRFMKRVLGERSLSAPTAVKPWSTVLIKSRMLHDGHLLVDSWTASTFEPHTSSLRTLIFSKSIGVSAPVLQSSK